MILRFEPLKFWGGVLKSFIPCSLVEGEIFVGHKKGRTGGYFNGCFVGEEEVWDSVKVEIRWVYY